MSASLLLPQADSPSSNTETHRDRVRSGRRFMVGRFRRRSPVLRDGDGVVNRRLRWDRRNGALGEHALPGNEKELGRASSIRAWSRLVPSRGIRSRGRGVVRVPRYWRHRRGRLRCSPSKENHGRTLRDERPSYGRVRGGRGRRGSKSQRECGAALGCGK